MDHQTPSGRNISNRKKKKRNRTSLNQTIRQRHIIPLGISHTRNRPITNTEILPRNMKQNRHHQNFKNGIETTNTIKFFNEGIEDATKNELFKYENSQWHIIDQKNERIPAPIHPQTPIKRFSTHLLEYQNIKN